MFNCGQELKLERIDAATGVALAPQAVAGVPRVLFADDAVAARVLVAALLRRMNLEVDVAHDGEEVLRLARTSRYDLILLDIDMPVMDGLATARQLRAAEKAGRRLPIIAVSGYLMETAAECGAQGLFDGAVAKPVSLARLWAVMAQLLPDGHFCAERSSVIKASRREVALVAPAGGLADAVDMEAALADLRRLAGDMGREMAGEGRGKTIAMKARELDLLAQRIGATRLQRRAAVLASAALFIRGDELSARTRDTIACVVGTISELKKRRI